MKLNNVKTVTKKQAKSYAVIALNTLGVAPNDLDVKSLYEEIECVGENDCCGKSNKNYIVEIQGFLNEEDEFITKRELEENQGLAKYKVLDLFVIRLYKCVSCGKWIIDILE